MITKSTYLQTLTCLYIYCFARNDVNEYIALTKMMTMTSIREEQS